MGQDSLAVKGHQDIHPVSQAIDLFQRRPDRVAGTFAADIRGEIAVGGHLQALSFEELGQDIAGEQNTVARLADSHE